MVALRRLVAAAILLAIALPLLVNPGAPATAQDATPDTTVEPAGEPLATETPTEEPTSTETPNPTDTATWEPTSTQTNTPAPTATNTPRPSATAAATSVPPAARISLSRGKGRVAGHVTASVRNFPPNVRIAIRFDSKRVGTVLTDQDGRGAIEILVPERPSGEYVITATGSRKTADVPFLVVGRVDIEPTKFEAGQQITVLVRGFGANVAVRVRLLGLRGTKAVSVWTIATNEFGTGISTVSTKRSTGAGQHGVTASQGDDSAQTSVRVTRPPATPTPTPKPRPTATTIPNPGCDPSYPTICIPSPPPDLDCDDIPYRRFEVIGRDPHNFDGDNDGIGCES